MALPICAEAIVRLFFVLVRLAYENWGWAILAIILVISIRVPVIFGIIGDIFNALDVIPGLNVLLGIKFLSPVFVSIMWAGMVLKARTVYWPIRLAALPIFMLVGFAWDAISNLPIPILGNILDLIPLGTITSLLLSVPGVAYAVIAIPAFYGLKLWIWGSESICGLFNKILEWL